jgi:hypothetical protein
MGAIQWSVGEFNESHETVIESQYYAFI